MRILVCHKTFLVFRSVSLKVFKASSKLIIGTHLKFTITFEVYLLGSISYKIITHNMIILKLSHQLYRKLLSKCSFKAKHECFLIRALSAPFKKILWSYLLISCNTLPHMILPMPSSKNLHFSYYITRKHIYQKSRVCPFL